MFKATHWGKWISERSRLVGYQNQRELADAVGCRSEQVSRWFQLNEPPRQMRKGFDRMLAASLKIEPEILFRGFREFSPEIASSINKIATDTMRRKVLAMVELMPDDGLKELARVGELLLRSGHVLQVA